MAKRKQNTPSPESSTNDDRSTASFQSESSPPKKRRLDAITSGNYYPIEFGPVPTSIVGMVGSSLREQFNLKRDSLTNGEPRQDTCRHDAAVPSGGNTSSCIAEPCLSHPSLKRQTESNGTAESQQGDNTKESDYAAVVPTAGGGSMILRAMGFSDDAHVDWEYGPISFSRFEHSLRAASDEVIDDEQITASIFDLPDHHDKLNTRTSAVAPEPEPINQNHQHHFHRHNHHHHHQHYHQPQWDLITNHRFPGEHNYTAQSAFELNCDALDQVTSSDHRGETARHSSVGSVDTFERSLPDL
jgi:hypothetical protein